MPPCCHKEELKLISQVIRRQTHLGGRITGPRTADVGVKAGVGVGVTVGVGVGGVGVNVGNRVTG